jgi:hypothetical protein
MEAASIDVELDKFLFHPQHLMKLSEKGNQVVNAT